MPLWFIFRKKVGRRLGEVKELSVKKSIENQKAKWGAESGDITG